MYHGLFKLSTIVGYLVLSNLSVLQTVMQWKLYVCVCQFVLVQVTYTDLSVGLIYKSGITRLRVNTFAVLGNISRRPLHRCCTHINFTSNIWECLFFFFSKLQWQCILNFWNFANLVGEKWHLNIILIFIFLIMSEDMYLFICLRVVSEKKNKGTQWTQ